MAEAAVIHRQGPADVLPATPPAGGRRVAFALLALAALLFIGFSARMIPAPFGDSHDGRNAGVWAAGSRSLLDRGPVASRLGTRSPENGVYANHPPLLYVETALFEAVGGRSPATSRAPAWVGSLATLTLLTWLLLEAGLRPTAVGAAVVLVASTPMLLIYGAMLDTPVTSLPFGLAVLLLWERARRGRPVAWPLAAGLTALAVLSGWQSLVVAAVVGGWAVLRLVRRSGTRRVDLAFAAGAAAGAVVLLGWLVWAFGGTLAPLFAQFGVRTGRTASISLRELEWATRHDVGMMFGIPALLAAVGLIAAVVDRRTRGLTLVALGVTLSYPVVFRSGAVNHDYWNYWLLLPVGLGLAAGFDRLLRAPGATARLGQALAASAAVVATLLAVVLWSRPDAPAWAILQGRQAGAVVDSEALAPGQQVAWYTGAIGKPAAWISLATGARAVAVPVADLPALAIAHPLDQVMVGRLECRAGEPHVMYDHAPAADVAARPPAVERCPSAPGATG